MRNAKVLTVWSTANEPMLRVRIQLEGSDETLVIPSYDIDDSIIKCLEYGDVVACALASNRYDWQIKYVVERRVK